MGRIRHDRGQCDRLYRVGDDQIFRRELALHSVERLQHLASERPPHQDLAAFEQVEIKDVRGMSHLPQRVIRGSAALLMGR